jgi:hypothetical protein
MKGKIKREWAFWQVVAPLGTPIFFSFLAVLFWELGPQPFTIKWDLILDSSPWALSFFSLTLIGAALHDLSIAKRLGIRGLGGILGVIGVFIGFFANDLVVWRQTIPNYAPELPIYCVAIFVLAVSIYFCHKAANEPETTHKSV